MKRLLGMDASAPHKIHAGDYPFLITGCGRSGTHFTAKFLELNGLDMGHEETGSMGAVGWLCASPEFCREQGATFARKAHQIRHPFNAIRSLITMNDNSWEYIFRYLPQCRHEDRLIAAGRYWVYWNGMSQQGAVLSIRLEDFRLAPEKVVADLSAFFGRALDPGLIAVAQEHGDSRKARRDYGHDSDPLRLRAEDPATWADLEKLAAQFNYDLSKDF